MPRDFFESELLFDSSNRALCPLAGQDEQAENREDFEGQSGPSISLF